MDNDFSPMERNQVEAALINQLDMLAQSERRMTPGTFEAECVIDAIRYTGSALTKIQLDRYGVDDRDDEDGESLWDSFAEMFVPQDAAPGELTELWGK